MTDIKKPQLRYDNLRTAMKVLQDRRAAEVNGHTWENLVEEYGIAIMFAEIATIVSRLKHMIWYTSPYEDLSTLDFDRALDLCIDLGNYTEFLYMSIMKAETEVGYRSSDILNPANIDREDPKESV